ncbi:DUF5060 domain-containing protein [Hymenobacter defluvii]|uniref:DUF5060 domain-containing protein n=1 Tax=Hymenobacter defluvii TaxID=2054411 RepID=A0ABS3TF63_9BACT|nr:DUF5060 domain-containing protein [Hymenobacter defluvii]MBO3272298.1 DUF5060 domain-containing protein [Hymenobacter defluvii]
MIHRNFVLLTLLWLLSARMGYAQKVIGQAVLRTPTIQQYEKTEWDIVLSQQFQNPYRQQEVTLDLVLTSPSGMPVVVPCYFEQNTGAASAWKARFAPREAGPYTGLFRLTRKDKTEEKPVDRFTVVASTKPGFLHANDLYTFRFDNGDLFRGVGENVGWEARSFENQKWTYDYLLPTLAKNGANFFRTWMCYWNLPLEWQKVSATKRYTNTTDYFNPGAIKRMDELVHLTDSLGLYFMLTFDWHGHLMEKGGWRNSPYNQLNGGPARTPTEFFTLPAARDKYKDKLRYVVARWGYSTNIGAWEFFNEIDNAVFTQQDSLLIPHDAVALWHGEMSRYLKDIDPYQHLVTTSISHRDILGMNSIAYIDFNQKHIYKHTEKIPAIYPSYIQTYGKPYVVGEFGYRWEDADPTYKEGFNYDYKRGLWYGLFSPTPILPMTWWWELFDDQQMTPYFRAVRTISDQMLAAGHGEFEPFAVTSGTVQSFGMRCGDTYFVYLLYNGPNRARVPVRFDVRGKKLAVQSFAPTTRQYSQLTRFELKREQLTLPDVTLDPQQEVVLLVKATK